MTKHADAAAREADAPPPPPPDPFAWDPDPVVAVSRRVRVLRFPAAVLLGPPSAEQKAAWFATPGRHDEASPALARNQNELEMVLGLGVTFLGSFTSAWRYLGGDFDRSPPREAPPREARAIVEPEARRAGQALSGPAFRDRETGDRLPREVAAAWVRAFEHMTDERNPLSELFRVEQGFDAPEVVVCPLSEVLGQTTDRGRQGFALASSALAGPRAGRPKNLQHLGALHDYAVRDRRAAALRDACRARKAKVDP